MPEVKNDEQPKADIDSKVPKPSLGFFDVSKKDALQEKLNNIDSNILSKISNDINSNNQNTPPKPMDCDRVWVKITWTKPTC